MPAGLSPFIIGWEEWLALPDLGLPAIKAKVDTGAKTSALHAFQIEPFGPAHAPMVRFGVHPVPRRPDIEVYCSAPVVGRREVTSSNGEKEMRFVIETHIAMGERVWKAEVTLTNRAGMAYHMLLGRQAIGEDMFVEPSTSFRQPRLSYKLYRHLPRREIARRSLRLVVLADDPEALSNKRLVQAAAARGHVVEVIDPACLHLVLEGPLPGLSGPEGQLAHYDAVIPRIDADAAGAHGPAVVRQLEMMGSFALNGGDAIERLSNPLAVAQALAGQGLAYRSPAVTGERSHPSRGPVRSKRYRMLVIGGQVAAALRKRGGALSDAGSRHLKAERSMAERAAATLGLGMATVDLATGGERCEVTRVSANPALGVYQSATGTLVAETIVAEIEAHVRSWVRRGGPAGG